ncbi:MAG: Mor transcription activator family protein [Pseudomonadota bacterium]
MTEQQLEAFNVDDMDALLELEHLDPAQRADLLDKIPERVSTLLAIFESELNGVVKNPTRIAERMVFVLANYFGGKKIYLPRNDALLKLMRNISIYRAYSKGAPIKDLMKKHRLTDVMVYRIISDFTAAERARQRAKTPDLFPETLEDKK